MIATLAGQGPRLPEPTNGDVNYAVRDFDGYGKLSGKSLDDLHAGERVAVADGKTDPLDFVLWKSAKPSEPDDAKWDSALTSARAVEASGTSSARRCRAPTSSANASTSTAADGPTVPYHENEIAQSEGPRWAIRSSTTGCTTGS